MTWQLRLNDIQPNGLDQIAFLCDVFDDEIVDEKSQPIVQYNIAPSFPNGTDASALKQTANQLGKKVQGQKAQIDALLSQVPRGTLIPIS